MTGHVGQIPEYYPSTFLFIRSHRLYVVLATQDNYITACVIPDIGGVVIL